MFLLCIIIFLKSLLIRLASFMSPTVYVQPEDYAEARKKFIENLDPSKYFNNQAHTPVVLTEVSDLYGKCFNLENEETPTLEQTYQGWIMGLNPELEYNVYMTTPGSKYPTMSEIVPQSGKASKT